MPDYKKMYLKLFNTVTDAIRELEEENLREAEELLKQGQLETEQIYIETDAQ